MSDKIRIALWIPKKLRERLRIAAKRKRWSMSLLNEVIIERYFRYKTKE